MATGKMSWLIEKHKNGNVSYEIQNTHRNHGAISKPTGSGKSALFINDIIYRIIHRENKKLMVNISTPIIKLCEQQGNDLMETLEGVASTYNINLNEVTYFINNSGNTDAYKKNTESALHSFNKASFSKEFINHPQHNVAIIINCHPSLSERMIPWLKSNNTDELNIVTYIDEAHTISSRIVSSENMDDTEIDLKTLCEKSSVYLVSATNKQELVKIVNSFDGINNDSYIIIESPAEAIEANKICAPKVHIKQTTTGEIDFNVCNNFMKSIGTDNNIHKVLVSCKDTKHLETLYKELKDGGYKVYYTCSKTGMNGDGTDNLEFTNSNHKFNDVISFIKAIDDCKTNCFILHIRQMISGIDVSSISDCIIQKNDTNNFNSYSNVIQTIGRSLRLGSERGKNVEDRTKKYANILFVTEETNESIYQDIDYFLINYYEEGHNKFHIEKPDIKNSLNNEEHVETAWQNMFIPTSSGEEINYWENIKVNIEQYILNKVKPLFDDIENLGISYNNDIENQINFIEKKYNENLNGIYIFKYIENKDLRKAIEEIMSKIFPVKY
mgnify:FL=1